MSSNDHDNIARAREYFIRADQGRPDVLELFHEDAEIYFPKFGLGFGRQSFLEMVNGFESSLEYIRHDYGNLTLIPSGDYVVVEGTSQGKMSGKSWAGGKTPGGRFCNVFKFRDGRISSLHVYLDPDYTGEDEARFRWGKESSVVSAMATTMLIPYQQTRSIVRSNRIKIVTTQHPMRRAYCSKTLVCERRFFAIRRMLEAAG